MGLPNFLTRIFSNYATPKIKESVTLPSQTGNTGKFLTTNGTSASWSDTLTNDLVFYGADEIKRANAASSLSIRGGTGATDGASLQVYGNGVSGYEGDFALTAHDGTDTTSLKGTPDGSLTWNGLPLFPIPNTPEAHNCFFRGKEHTVANLSAMIQDNNFNDIFIGDYFRASFSTEHSAATNTIFRIAGINYFQNVGSSAQVTPHVVIVPDGCLGTYRMNSTDTTVGGYSGSEMHSTILPEVATGLKSAIGASHVLEQKLLMANAINASTSSMAGAGLTGASSSWAWLTFDLSLLSEAMVTGNTANSSSYFDALCQKQQLPLFALNPRFVNIGDNWWIGTVASSTQFVGVASYGAIAPQNASTSYFSFRPYFVFH